MLNKLSTAAITTAFVLSASAAMAQSMAFADVDTDADGILSNEELVAAFGVEGAAILMADDTDGDGMLSVAEIRIATDTRAADDMSGDASDIGTVEERAASDDAEDPDYRDEGEKAISGGGQDESEDDGMTSDDDSMEGEEASQ